MRGSRLSFCDDGDERSCCVTAGYFLLSWRNTKCWSWFLG